LICIEVDSELNILLMKM